jgi:aminopeptidase N
MRFIVAMSSILMVAQAAIAGAAIRNESPFPDPVEHSAFQRRELERAQGWRRLAEEAPSKRSRLQDRYDVTYYRLALDLRNVGAERIRGDLTAVVRAIAAPLDTIYFDLSGAMDVDSVKMRGMRAAFSHAGDGLIVRPPLRPLPEDSLGEVRIYYQGHPMETGFAAFGYSTHAGNPLIWSLSEPNGARQWWPCKDRPDDKADSLDVLLRVPVGLVATSNGLLTDTTNHPDGSHTFHWKHRYPITTYLVCVTATDYERIEDRYVPAPGDTMLVEHFVYPEWRTMAEIDFSITPEAIGAFAERFGPYPFLREKYGHTLFPWSGGMEHQTNTSYGSSLITGLNRFDWLTVHELAHQWWGDMTSPADWRDVWLNEGFATYSEAIWYEHVSGMERYHSFMTNACQVYDPSGPLYDPIELFDGNTVYNKGGWVMHMLRGAIGDSLFFASLAEYRERTAYRSTTTAEFQSIVEEVSGRSMDWFFQPWVYGIDRPHYAVSFLPYGDPGFPSVAIHLEQTQTEPAFFEMPVEFRIELEGGSSIRARIWNDPEHGDIELDLPAVAVDVTVDPDDWILDAAETVPYTMHITTTELPGGHAGDSYEATIHGRGGTPPYEWAAVDPLPSGIEIDPATGRLTGTAPDSGSYAIAIRLIDHVGLSDIQNYRWTVAARPEAGGACCASDGVCTITQDTACLAPSVWHADWAACEPSPCPQPSVALKIGPQPAKSWVGFTIYGPRDGRFGLKIYDLLGREIRTVWDGPLPPRTISWNGKDDSNRDVPSGVYIARLKSGGSEIKRRVVWVR